MRWRCQGVGFLTEGIIENRQAVYLLFLGFDFESKHVLVINMFGFGIVVFGVQRRVGKRAFNFQVTDQIRVPAALLRPRRTDG